MTRYPESLQWFDAHLDLAYLALSGRDMLKSPAESGSFNQPACITLPALQAAQVKWALGTIFTEPGGPQYPYGYQDANDIAGANLAGRLQLEIYQQWEKQGHVRIIKTSADLDPHPAQDDPLQIILLMECADPIMSMDDAHWWHEQGVRVVGLAWTYACRYAMGNGVAPDQGGLTDAGKAMVRTLDDLGIVHDLTHLNHTAASELLALATGPVVATHSASRTLQEKALPVVEGMSPGLAAQRHISDEHLALLQKRGGMVGLPLYDKFLRKHPEHPSNLRRVMEHLNYLADKLGGWQHVGIGSDFDGGFTALQTPQGLEGPERLHNLAASLCETGRDESAIRAIACENWLRYFKQVLP